MYTLEKLELENVSAEYKLNSDDVEKVNQYKTILENSRNCNTPKPGDSIQYTNKHGDYYPHAHLDKDKQICMQGQPVY